MKTGDEVFIRALEVRGVVTATAPVLRVRYKQVGHAAIDETFDAADVEPIRAVCDHHWGRDDGDQMQNPTHCLICGMSIERWAFTMAP